MEVYVNWDNCRKQYPKIEFRLDIRGILHVIGPNIDEYHNWQIVYSIVDTLRRDNEELAFSSHVIMRTSSNEKWHAEISIGVKAGYFVKESSEVSPENGEITREFAILRFPNPDKPLSDEFQVYQVNSGEEAHKMAFEDHNCIGYALARRVDTKVDGKVVWGELNTYKIVVFGKVYTKEEVRHMKEGIGPTLLTMMIIFGRNKYVQTRNGSFIPWEEGVEYFSEGIE